jgi:hypothetical protein
MKTGSCLCGAVTFEFDEPARPVIVCHCMQCRKQTGAYAHFSSVSNDRLRVVDQGSLKWYRASTSAARGFCGECGSVLFWKPDSGDRTSFSAGAVDGPTGFTIEGHIYCDFKGDYYELPPNEGYRKREWED